jgi:hypothetical protein
MYEYVDYMLANYLNVNVCDSEADAILALRSHIASSVELSKGILADLEGALVDAGYSWKEAFSRNDVIFFDDEAQAREYARRLLWEKLSDLR